MLRKIAQGILSLTYPHLCLACGKDSIPNEDILCLSCLYQLPKTKQHLQNENRFTDRFWGRIDIHSAGAYIYYNKEGVGQKLLQKLKYQGYWQIGYELGKQYGQILNKAPLFSGIDYILPVPLHPRRLKKRGYNQSDVFAKGLSERMGIPWKSNMLIRTLMTATQTTKSRMERFANVEHAFKLSDPDALKGKHVLLVDDVLTTGATLEAAGRIILDVSGTKLSMACIAMADNL